jgi:hypothetical protein
MEKIVNTEIAVKMTINASYDAVDPVETLSIPSFSLWSKDGKKEFPICISDLVKGYDENLDTETRFRVEAFVKKTIVDIARSYL